jgi:DNA helicase HerA-like ATPase
MFSTNVAEHIALVADIFGDTYNFTHPQTYMFKMAMEATISSYKAYGEDEPNLRALVKMIERYPSRSYYDNETKMALLRRIKPLIEGQAEKAFIGKRYLRIDEIFNKNIVIELGHIRETKIRQIYSQILLKQIYDYKISKGTNQLNHISVLEEARYIVPYRRDYDPPTIAERMINEMRKFGESIFLVTQFPTQISKDTIKNAGMTILHRIVGQEDLKMILNVISLDEKQINYIKEMETGEAIVKDGRYPLPIHIKVIPDLP